MTNNNETSSPEAPPITNTTCRVYSDRNCPTGWMRSCTSDLCLIQSTESSGSPEQVEVGDDQREVAEIETVTAEDVLGSVACVAV